ncbi:MAG: hypothetical protein QXJ68_04370 [Methanocellales archaeon]
MRWEMGKYHKGVKKYHKGCGGEVEVIARSTPEPGVGYWCKKCGATPDKNEITEMLPKK